MILKHNKTIFVVLFSLIITLCISAIFCEKAYAAQKIHLQNSDISIQIGEKSEAVLIGTNGKAISSSAIKWSSSNKKVATVSSKGKITAKKGGIAKITAKYKNKSYVLKVSIFDDVNLDYNEIIKEINKNHEELNSHVFSIDVKQFWRNIDDYDLLSDDELKQLLDTSHTTRPKTVTKEQAKSDIDVLFRLYKSSYPAYYYFGEDKYEKALKGITDWIDSNKKTVNVDKLAVTISEKLSFMRDSHSYIGAPKENLENYKYHYYYCENESFAKDSRGYYRKLNGKKWYYKKVNRKDVSMELSLQPNGNLCYSPVLFTTDTKIKDSTITLENESGKKMNLSIIWVLNEPYGYTHSPDFNYIEENGYVFISERRFNMEEDTEALKKYIESGKKARNAKLIIYDLRSNGGGGDGPSKNFIKNLTGQSPDFPNSSFSKYSKFTYMSRPLDSGRGYVEHGFTKGNFIKNDIPMVLLVDDLCGSAGESALNFAKCVENVMVIGSNSAGYQLVGNVLTSGLSLPNTRIGGNMGFRMNFMYGTENVDGKGYAPDVWTNPATAFTAVMNMLEKQGLIDSESKDVLIEKVKPAFKTQREVHEHKMTIDYYGYTVVEKDGFGRIVDDYLPVYVDGKRIKDFTVTSEDPSIIQASVTSSGKLHLVCKKNVDNNTNIIITYKGEHYLFRPTTMMH